MGEPPPALHRTIMGVDVQGFGDKRRTNPDQLAVREGLYGCLRAAFAGSGITWGACYHEDRGDGVLFLIPPDIPKKILATKFLREFSAALHSYNEVCTASTRIRVRLALHAGEVHHDSYGVVGAAINTSFRLLEAAPLKRALARSSGVLAVIVSQWFFDEVVRHIPVSNPSSYRHVRVSVKETETVAWICRPDDPFPPLENAVLPMPPQATRPRQLPHAIVAFADREHELKILTHLLGLETSPNTAMAIAVVQGTAGVGKSALVVNWAHSAVDRFPDGQLYVNLRGFDPTESPMSPAEVMRGFLDAFEVPAERIPVSLDAQAALYRSLLADRRVLIVLDNAHDADQVRPLLPGAPGCAVVVTSRSQLTSLAVAEGAHLITLNLLTAEQAIELLTRRLGANRVAAEPHAVTDIVTTCARLPLALAMVAARAAINPTFSLAVFAGGLTSAQGRLDAFAGTDAMVGAAFSWSYRQLSDDAAMLFRLLGLHHGPDIAMPAAANLAAVSPAQAQLLLNELTRAHLINERAPGRFTFHDLLRAYAYERCQAEETSEQCGKAVGRLASWYLATADAADRFLAPLRRHVHVDFAGNIPLSFQNYDAALAWCEAERENLIATVQMAATAGHHEQAWKLAMALVTFFHLRKYRIDRLATCNIALESARQINDRSGEAWSALNIGAALADLHRPDDAIASYNEAFEKWLELNDKYGQAMALNDLSEAYCDIGRFDEALARSQDALLLWREIKNPRSEAITLNCMGIACNALERPREAVTYLERALQAVRSVDRYTEGISLHILGISYMKLGHFQTAGDRFHEALTCQRETGDRYGEAQTLHDLALLQRQLNHITGARFSLRLAISIFRDLDDPQLPFIEAEMNQLQDYD